MFSLKIRFLLALSCLLPAAVIAQPISVLGGGQKAQQCFMNAELAAQNRAGIGKTLLEPCDYTLKYSKLSVHDQAATHANRGIVYAALSDFDAAMDDYETAISMVPSAPEFYVNRGNSLFMIKEYSRALDDYEHSIELGIKQLHFVHYNMGMVYERLGNDKVAEKEYLKALEFDPDWELAKSRLQIVQKRMAEDAAAKEEQ